MDSQSVRRMILQTNSLPTIPSTLYHIIECVNDEDSSARDLKKIILRDQSISAKVLNVANSAWFGFTKKVEDISRAIVVLGFDTVLEIAMYVSFSTFINEASRSASFNPEQFWMHSIASSESAKIISKDLSVTTNEIANLIGLLHDVGKVMINYLYPREYADVLDNARISGRDLNTVEKEKLGFDHSDVGKWLGEKWKFPPRLVSCISGHHLNENNDSVYGKEIKLAGIANNLAKSVNIGFSGNSCVSLKPGGRSKLLTYSDTMLQEWTEKLSQEEEKIKSFVFHMK